MTSLGFLGLSSSQSVSACFGSFRPENPETDFRGLSSPSVSGFFGSFRPENPETGWDYKPGIPRLVMPVRFVFFARLFRPENPETDWDDKPGLPRVVIPVRFVFLWPFSAKRPRNRLG